MTHSKFIIQNSKFSFRGFILVEFLVASVLFSLAGSGLTAGFIQGIKAKNRMEQSFRICDPFRKTFLLMEKDLRNAVTLRDYPFEGKETEIRFPMRFENGLYLIRYSLENQALVRSKELLSTALVKEKPEKRALIIGLKSLQFSFSHHNEAEDVFFEPLWLEEPYYGIPRAVKINIEREGINLQKTVSIPQGKLGYLNE